MILSQSAIATVGYCIPQAEVTIYSVEELAYLCMYKGYLLDSDFACKKLVQWIEEQCGCEDLAFRLAAALKEKNKNTAFVETILHFTGCVSEGEISRIIQEISEGLGMSGFERKKAEADKLYQQQRFVQAAQKYTELLELVPEGEISMRAACYYNLAAARAQMFLYEQALDALEASYRLKPEEDTLLTWLGTARLLKSEEEYLKLLDGREDLYQLSMQLEEQIKKLEASVLTTGNGQELEKLREWMQYGGEDGFYVASCRVLRSLCEEYRAYYE